MNSPISPTNTRLSQRSVLYSNPSSPVANQLLLNEIKTKTKKCVFWGIFNFILLAILLYDLMSRCYQIISYVEYCKYFLSTVLAVNCVHYLFWFLKLKNKIPAPVVKENVVAANTSMDSSNFDYQNMVVNSFSRTPMDFSAASWLTNTSQNVSNLSSTPRHASQLSRSLPIGSPQQNLSPCYRSSPLSTSNLKKIELQDENSINQYMKEYEALETSAIQKCMEKPMNFLSLFWNHPKANVKEEVSPIIKNCQYQLSTSASSSPKTDEKGSPMDKSSKGLDTWRLLNIDSVALTQWNENLRIWISETILCRLIKEFANIDKSLHNQGLTDVKMGGVGLDRLRKIAQGPIVQNIPNLPTIVPFLELHPNQEYLVKRIGELAKGGCMSEYRWNGGSNYEGKKWDNSLPTDAAIVMHLMASYLDTQLLPLPSKPEVKPFSGFHFIRANEKLPELTQQTLAIHEVTANPPHYRVITGLDTYEMVKGYSNLFHSILLFLYHINQKEHSMLGRINLGRAGVNMMWIIQSN